MRSLYFLLPGTNGKYVCGGLFAELKTMELARQVCAATVVTYEQREPQTLFLDDVLQQDNRDAIFVVSWGFHVPKLVKKLARKAVIYHAHSAGYGFRLPSGVPILTVSRNTMGYWGQQCPSSPIFWLPNQISPEFSDRGQPRDIDVLVQVRKSSQYLLQQLVPALKPHCHVVLLDHFVEDLAGLFNRSKIYLYDTAEYWAQYKVSEGFGLPPMEAMACGCQVFSSVNGALADYLDPGFNCQSIGTYSTQYDADRLLAALKTPASHPLSEGFLAPYREDKIVVRLQHILTTVNHFFDHAETQAADVPSLSSQRIWQLRLQRLYQKVAQKMGGNP